MMLWRTGLQETNFEIRKVYYKIDFSNIYRIGGSANTL